MEAAGVRRRELLDDWLDPSETCLEVFEERSKRAEERAIDAISSKPMGGQSNNERESRSVRVVKNQQATRLSASTCLSSALCRKQAGFT